jgi:predicted flap endonuclease-1-like 5' DNA nuclease
VKSTKKKKTSDKVATSTKVADTDSKTPIPTSSNDDLSVIKWLGPKASEALEAADITTFTDLVSAGVDGTKKALEQAGGRLASTDPTPRIEEAQKIVAST